MIDYIQIDYHFTDKDTPNLQDFQGVAPDKYGWKSIELKRVAPIGIKLNERMGILRVKGSFMYFLQGHNLTFCRDGFVSIIEWLNADFNINLWDGIIEQLEVCVIVEVEDTPYNYIRKHWEPKGWIVDDCKTTRYFKKGKALKKENAEIFIKMYDVRENLKFKCKGVDLELIGLKPKCNYLKFEIHYNKPHKYLNNGRWLRLRDVFTLQMQERLKNELKGYYGQIKREFVVTPPDNRGDLGTSTILAMYGMEKAVNSGQSVLNTQKEVYNIINQIPVFTQADKANRRREVKKVFDKLGQDVLDKWDLTKEINKVLDTEENIILFNV